MSQFTARGRAWVGQRVRLLIRATEPPRVLALSVAVATMLSVANASGQSFSGRNPNSPALSDSVSPSAASL